MAVRPLPSISGHHGRSPPSSPSPASKAVQGGARRLRGPPCRSRGRGLEQRSRIVPEARPKPKVSSVALRLPVFARDRASSKRRDGAPATARSSSAGDAGAPAHHPSSDAGSWADWEDLEAEHWSRGAEWVVYTSPLLL
ncbi:hypothetical protein PR202_ga16373 [Eleusine coracana subsp. coracana]|uniref:Uncharacterized protein n=1 Tax=Eleusine coracana subsp. coracana TaxID=191504 RepID=A0AAV5CM21_ELECO|nr:hypothetical protein PR202_ga16373 [Eleusine coracana subsp. coracana]